MYLIGYDIGSSSIKAALVDIATGKKVATAQYPSEEMPIQSPESGFAEQDPELWWQYLGLATKQLLENYSTEKVQAIGISYQMHGLVLVDEAQKVLRPAIIWCDSRAVEIGNQAFARIGVEKCLSHHLNSPGNFTASKMRWVKENEPDLFDKTHKMMLPGDFIAMKMTGEIKTTASGLSEGILWDFKYEKQAQLILDDYQIPSNLLPDLVPSIGKQGNLSINAAQYLGLEPGIPIAYRAGDQPNNALSLNVLKPGEVAATGGTSGVVYGVMEKAVFDPKSRVNSFAHVNHSKDAKRIGVLLCINGAGILNNWVRKSFGEEGISYAEMGDAAAKIEVGSDGLSILPFGNGAERLLENKNPGASIHNLQLNRHRKEHFYRAALEGIAFSFVKGMDVLKEMGMDVGTLKVGNDNLFQSPIFSQTIANLVGSEIQVIETNGAIGAARAAGVGAGFFVDFEEAMQGLSILEVYRPSLDVSTYKTAYKNWLSYFNKI